jgi:hypothetical protein
VRTFSWGDNNGIKVVRVSVSRRISQLEKIIIVLVGFMEGGVFLAQDISDEAF